MNHPSQVTAAQNPNQGFGQDFTPIPRFRRVIALGFLLFALTGCSTVPGAILAGSIAAGAIGYTAVKGETPIDSLVGYAEDMDCNSLRLGRDGGSYCRPVGHFSANESTAIAEEQQAKKEAPYWCYKTLGGQKCYSKQDESRNAVALQAANKRSPINTVARPLVVKSYRTERQVVRVPPAPLSVPKSVSSANAQSRASNRTSARNIGELSNETTQEINNFNNDLNNSSGNSLNGNSLNGLAQINDPEPDPDRLRLLRLEQAPIGNSGPAPVVRKPEESLSVRVNNLPAARTEENNPDWVSKNFPLLFEEQEGGQVTEDWLDGRNR